MKKFLGAFMLISIISLICGSCQKDEVTQKSVSTIETARHVSDDPLRIENSSRTGSYESWFYPTSVTTDNAILWQQPRTQISFNRDKIDSIYMQRYRLNEEYPYYGVVYGFYDVSIKFIDGTWYKGQHMAPIACGLTMKYKPSGGPLFQYAYKVIQFEKTPFKTLYWDKNYGFTKTKWRYIISVDLDTVGTDYINGTTPGGSIYFLNHQ